MRVLVVDDYRWITNALCRQLRLMGHDVRAAYSGRAAITEAARFTPDVVLLDLVLPDVSGLEVAEVLRATAEHPIYIAAIATRIDEMADNFDEHMQKPFGIERLVELLARATRRPLAN